MNIIMVFCLYKIPRMTNLFKSLIGLNMLSHYFIVILIIICPSLIEIKSLTLMSKY